MREFFIQCLEDLEPLTGIKQYFFMQRIDELEFKKQSKVLIDGMVRICDEFPRINETRKKQIIREQMVKDQTYDSLNSRTIYRWLSQHNPIALETFTEAPRVELTEEASKRIDELAEQFKANLKGIGVSIEVSEAELETIRQEDNARQGRSQAKGYKPPTAEQIQLQEDKREWGKLFHDPLTADKLPNWIPFEEWVISRM